MTTLVTGGNGWVPSHVVRRLANRGEQVVSYDLMPPDQLLIDFLATTPLPPFTVSGDVTDLRKLSEVASQYGVDRIVHAAAITPRIDRERREPDRIVDVNLGGTVNALETARQLPAFKRFVYVSSTAVWGDIPGAKVLTEDSPTLTTSLYGITKLASERISLRYQELFGLDVVAVRPANVYGPMERVTPGFVGATELREMLRIHFGGESVRVNSLQGPWRDWTHVEDIAEGIERALFIEQPRNRVYSLTCGRLFSIGNLLEQFALHLPGFEYELITGKRANYRVEGGAPGPVPSNALMWQDFGWRPSIPFETGMQQYLAWIQSNGPQ